MLTLAKSLAAGFWDCHIAQCSIHQAKHPHEAIVQVFDLVCVALSSILCVSVANVSD